ncbi:MAG: ABC transporter ATP-binding protein [Clostridiaceae bacterium]|nr:ABC transporter ATP-binding protein [Clostridiaceae bacterium]
MDRKAFKTKKPLALFASFYKPHLKLFILDLICALGIALVSLAFPLLTRYGLSNLLPSGRYTDFIWMMVGLVIAFIVKAGLQYIVTYWGHSLGVRMEADMRQTLFNHMQTLSYRFYDNNRTGNLMSRVVNDLFEIVELAHHGPEDLFIALVTLIGSFIAMAMICWELALIIIILIPIIVFISFRGRNRMTAASKKVKQNVAMINEELESSISGVRVAQAFNNEEHEKNKFSDSNNAYRTAKNGFYKAMAGFSSSMEFWTAMLNLVVVGVGAYFIVQSRLTLTDMLTFTLFVNTFLTPIRKLITFFEQYANGMAGFQRFVELMRLDPDIVDEEGAIAIQNVEGEIRFEDVSFSYTDHESVLEHLNLHIKPGHTLALVGPSGGGKTTLCQLIPRFYEVDAGRITLDGIDIRNITLSSLRRNIGIVQQDVFLFATSIKENIRYGSIGATDEDVVKAAKAADIHDFIMTLPNGYDTQVGERGARLSGGQKQRLSIARIFLKNPPILILDEATSALDTATELRVRKALDRLAEGRTCLIIAHRLSTVQNADQIIYIDESGIRESGTHNELIEKKGYYFELQRAQFGDEESTYFLRDEA